MAAISELFERIWLTVTPPKAGPGLAITTRRELPLIPLVSCVCPTTAQRRQYHPHLYECFTQQTWPRRDLWVLEDAPDPSPFFSALRDPRVHYAHVAPGSMTLGAARNALIRACKGDAIAHQDDDDTYCQNYLADMLYGLIDRDADFVKLARWNERREVTGTRSTFETHTGEDSLWGWGFSYMYRRSAAAHASFPEAIHAEDIAFVRGLQAAGLKTSLIHDGAGWVEHLIHGWNQIRL